MRKLSLLRERVACSPHAWGALIVFTSVVLAAPGARAVNEPRLQSTSPAAETFQRSTLTPSISARFDRDLALPPSWITLRDRTGATFSGTAMLTGARSNTGGYRTMSYLLSGALSEALSPYTGIVHACPYVPGDCTDTQFRFHIDDTAPAPPVVTAPVDGSVNEEQQVVARGTAEPGSTVVIFERHQELARTTVHTDGTWLVQLPYPPEDGTVHTVSIRVTDPAANWSDPVTVTFRHDCLTRPPVILEPLQNSSYGTTSVPVAGTAKANTTVRVMEGATLLATTPAGADERWSTAITVGEGTHVIVAYSDDTYETDGPSQARTFTVDLTGPAPPVILQPGPAAYVATQHVTISGTAEPGASVRIREGGVARTTTSVAPTGEWSTSLTFSEGAHTITAETVDAAGNAGPQASRSFTVDTIAPGAPLISTPAQDAFLNSGAVYVSGTAEPSSTVHVLEGQAVRGTAVADGGGSWSATISLPDAAHTIQAQSTDLAGNAGPRSLPRSFVVDTVAPAVPVIVSPAAAATVTSNPVAVRGTGEQASRVTLFESSVVIGTTIVDAAGNWTVSVTLANGVHTVVAQASDVAGNTSAFSAPRTFTVNVPIDTTPPVAPTIVDPPEGSLQPAAVSFRGFAEPRAVVRVYEGSSLIGTSNATSDGSWAFGTTLAGGTHVVTATATDEAGNVGPPSALRTFTVDDRRPMVTIDPASPVLHVPALIQDEIFGQAADNHAVVRVRLEYRNRVTNTLAGSATAETCTGCPGSAIGWASVPDDVALPGVYLVRATAVDAAGNHSDPATATIVIV